MSILSRNNVNVSGQGTPTLLFAHGCSQTMWRAVAPAFEATNRVVLFDYVGRGESDLSAFDAVRYGDLYGYARDFLDVCEALSLAEGVVFVGHSVSCSVGVLASIARPRLFERMVWLGPSPCFINHPPQYHGGFEREGLVGLLALMDQNHIGWAQYLAPVIAGKAGQAGHAGSGQVEKELTDSFCSTDLTAARALAQATFFADNRTDLAAISVPTLILQHRDDALAPLAVGEYLHRQFQGSDLRVLTVCGNCAHMSNPDLVISAIHGDVR